MRKWVLLLWILSVLPALVLAEERQMTSPIVEKLHPFGDGVFTAMPLPPHEADNIALKRFVIDFYKWYLRCSGGFDAGHDNKKKACLNKQKKFIDAVLTTSLQQRYLAAVAEKNPDSLFPFQELADTGFIGIDAQLITAEQHSVIIRVFFYYDAAALSTSLKPFYAAPYIIDVTLNDDDHAWKLHDVTEKQNP